MVATPTLPNDASFSGIAGSPTISQGEHSQIRMESEKVVLTLTMLDEFTAPQLTSEILIHPIIYSPPHSN